MRGKRTKKGGKYEEKNEGARMWAIVKGIEGDRYVILRMTTTMKILANKKKGIDMSDGLLDSPSLLAATLL